MGDTITIHWYAVRDAGDAVIEISMNDGLSWTAITPQAIVRSSEQWEHYKWRVPSTIRSDEDARETAIAGEQILLRIHNCLGGYSGILQGRFYVE